MSEGEPHPEPTDHQEPGSALARLAPSVVVLVVGLATTAFLHSLARDTERREATKDLENLGRQRETLIQKKVDSAVEVVRAMAALFASSADVDREEFATFTGRLAAGHPEIRTMEWIQRVTSDQRAAAEAQLQGVTQIHIGIWEFDPNGDLVRAPERELHYPTIYLLEPGGDSGGRLLGFDNASLPAVRTVLDSAIDPAATTASPWVSRHRGALAEGEPVSVLIAAPVFAREATATGAPGAGLAPPAGWVMASVRIAELLAGPGLEQLKHYLVEGDITAAARSTGPHNLLEVDSYGLTSKRVPGSELAARLRPGLPHTVQSVKIGDSATWSLLLSPAADRGAGISPGPESWAKWVVLGGGVGFSILLAAYLFNVVGRTSQVSATVERRTAELRREIAERERAERTLKNSEALYHSLVESAPMCIYRKDLKGRFVFGNSSYAKTIGKSKSALVGLTDYDLFPKELADKYRADDERVVASGEVLEDVEGHQTPDGRSLYVHIIKAPVTDAFGNTVGSQGMFWDVTERHEAEERLRQTADELARSNADLEQFAYVASHDLQEPLRMVASYTQLLQRRYADKIDAEATEFIRFAVDGAVRMQRLIEDLLEYSRVGTRGKPLAAVDASQALDDALANLKVALGESGATVTRDQLPDVMADPVQLTQVFQNLISNGIKFHRPGIPPEVHVGAKHLSDGNRRVVEFTVRDNGIGIEEGFFERIFVIFQRLHTRDAFPGTGIGLALCKKIIERHGGRIWVKSTVGAGTTFFFTLRAAGSQVGPA
jgi:PAS domain S-box-containing protein